MTHRNAQGFTLIELMLSMAFISFLLLAIALLVLQISSTYNKGLTLRSVNEAGQFVSRDIQRSLNTANNIKISQANDDAAPDGKTGGRVCAGDTIYAWNYGGSLDNSDAFNKYDSGGPSDAIRLVKFKPASGISYCKANADDGVYPSIPAGVTNLLEAGETNLAVHHLTVDPKPVEGDPTQTIYSITMTIGTNETSTINTTNSNCKPPANKVDDEYCAVNEFKFTARAGNN